MDLLELLQVVVRRKWLITAIFLVTVIIAAVFSFLSDPVYEATTTMMTQNQNATELMLFDSLGGGGANNAVQNYVEILKSRTLLEQVREEVGLEEEGINSLRDRLTVQPIQGTDILRLSMQSTDPVEAQVFVNTLASAFIDWNRNSRQEDTRSAREFIESQLESISGELMVAEEQLKSYRESERVFAPSAETVAKLEQIAVLEAQLAEVDVSRAEIFERISQIQNQIKSQDETYLATTTIAQNPFVTQYQSRLADLEISLSGARERYTGNHPEVLRLEAEIEDVKRKLSEQVERVISTETRSRNPLYQELYSSLVTLEVELMALDSREGALGELLAQEEQVLGALPTKELELARLMREAKVLEETYIMLMQRNEETRIAEAMQTADVQVIDAAIIPENPVKPRIVLNIAIAAVLGVFLGVGVAFVLEFIDTSVKTKEEAEALLGLSVLGQIPDFEFNRPNPKTKLFG